MRGRWRVLAGVGTLAVAVASSGCGDAADAGARLAAPERPTFAAIGGGAETETSTERVPFNAAMPNCDGVPTVMTGELHLVNHVTLSPNGSTHFTQNLIRVNVVADVGGVTYRATGGVIAKWNFNGPPPISTSFIQNFRVVSQGPGDNLQFHSTLHVTINANRVVTTRVDNTRFDCQG